MRTLKLLIAILLLIVCLDTNGQSPNTGQQLQRKLADSTSVAEPAGSYQDTGDLPPVLFLTAFGMIFFLVLVGSGIVITMMLLLVLFALVPLGILSTSFIVGLYNRSFIKGFKTFWYGLFILGGSLLSALTTLTMATAFKWWTFEVALIIGSICGPPAGFASGWLSLKAFSHITSYFKRRLNVSTTDM